MYKKPKIPEFPDSGIVPHYLKLLRSDRPNVLTIHAEIEGMGKEALFRELLEGCRAKGVEFIRLDELAETYLAAPEKIPVKDMILAEIDGRSGKVAVQAR